MAADADRHLAILSRRPLKAVTTHTDLQFTYFGAKETVKRGLLEATFETATGEFTLFVVHLKSRFTDRPDDPMSAIRRAGEATAIRDRVLKRFPIRRSRDSSCWATATTVARVGRWLSCRNAGKPKSRRCFRRRIRAARRGPIRSARKTRTRASITFSFRPVWIGAVQNVPLRIYDGDGVREASDHRPVFVVLDSPAK